MKNDPKKNKPQHPLMDVTATFEQANLMDDLVQILAHGHYDSDLAQRFVLPGMKAFEIKPVETYVAGTIVLSGGDEIINMPFVTSFMFVCFRESLGSYNLAWGNSLS